MSSYSGSFKQNLTMPQPQYRQEGARPPVNQKHMKGHGELLLPDQHLTQLQLCFQNLWAYLTMQGQSKSSDVLGLACSSISCGRSQQEYQREFIQACRLDNEGKSTISYLPSRLADSVSLATSKWPS